MTDNVLAIADRPWWHTAIQWTLWAIVMATVSAWLARSRNRRRPVAVQRVLAHPPSTLIVGILCFLLFGFFLIISNVFPNATVTWWTNAALAALVLLSVAIVLDYFLAWHELSEDGMAYRKLTGARRYLRWSDLRSVRYSSMMKWYVLKTHTGQVARLSAWLMGLPELARLILAHAPKESISRSTLPILEATAAGEPPSAT